MQLNYKVFGQGEPIIILHGLFGMLDNWQTLARKLAEHYTVFIVDQRNHGRSPHVDAHDYESMAEDLRLFMESQFVLKAHIIGHSMGGKTAMQFASHYPDMVDRLVIVDIAPKKYPAGHQEIFAALLALDLAKAETRKDVEEQLKTKIPEAGIRQFLMKNITRQPDNGFQLRMNLPVIYRDYEKILDSLDIEEAFEGPSLFVRGGRSKYVAETDLELIQEYFTEAQLETIENAGHWVHAEAPKELLASLLTFLSK
ncbi:MAG: alpha/beta fold hydrolase [Saprospiraceae bacterium]